MASHKFRFGVVAAQESTGRAWLDKARRVESMGFATMVLPDTLSYSIAPFEALAAAASITSTLRLGTYVINNDYRHPVMLAKEAATLDFLSGGRLELGIGAGRPAAAADNAMLGLAFDSGSVRVDRLEEALQIVKPLLRGEKVDLAGKHYTVKDAKIAPTAVQAQLPTLIAASQPRLLKLAAREADIIALAIQWKETEAEVARRIRLIRDTAGDRYSSIAININLMAVAGRLPRQVEAGLGPAGAKQLVESDAIAVLKGSIDEMCERLEWLRERLSISYILVADQIMDALEPIVARMAGR